MPASHRRAAAHQGLQQGAADLDGLDAAPFAAFGVGYRRRVVLHDSLLNRGEC